jgi:hypothetical protein
MVISLFPAGAINDTTFRRVQVLHPRKTNLFADIRPSQRQCELSITAIGCGGILYNDDRANYFEYIAAALYNIRYTNLTCGDRCQRFDNRVSCMPTRVLNAAVTNNQMRA